MPENNDYTPEAEPPDDAEPLRNLANAWIALANITEHSGPIGAGTLRSCARELLAALATLRGELEETRRRLERESRMCSEAIAQRDAAQQRVRDIDYEFRMVRRGLKTNDALLARAQDDRAAERAARKEAERRAANAELKVEADRHEADYQAQRLAEAERQRDEYAEALNTEHLALVDTEAEVVRLREALEEAREDFQFITDDSFESRTVARAGAALRLVKTALAAPTQTTDPSETTETT